MTLHTLSWSLMVHPVVTLSVNAIITTWAPEGAPLADTFRAIRADNTVPLRLPGRCSSTWRPTWGTAGGTTGMAGSSAAQRLKGHNTCSHVVVCSAWRLCWSCIAQNC